MEIAREGRMALHTRRLDVVGYRRDDGRLEVEATLDDVRDNVRGAAAGQAAWQLHRMSLLIVLDHNLLIEAAEATMAATPYPSCPGAAPSASSLVGLRIAPGFLKNASQRLGGPAGCTHLREMLQQIGTVALQTRHAAQQAGFVAPSPEPVGRPGVIDSCHGYRADGPVVAARWPQHAASGSETV